MATGATSNECGRCGTGNTLDSNYCKSCGAPLAPPTSEPARRVPLEIAGQGANAMAAPAADASRFLWRWVGLAAAFALVLLLLASSWVKGQLDSTSVAAIAWKSLAATALAGLFTGLAVGRLGRGRVILESVAGAAFAYAAVALLVATQGRWHVAQLIGLAAIAVASAVGAWLGALLRGL
ncbi:MAG: zinc ribbon domain-containing protein [Deltaproteobacteria bacterium]|nr:zinc ribbon domain-containing protein [Deltaproteobacteria bacterium]